MMKILQIGLSYNPGGIESCIMDYYRQLVKWEVQFDFICMYEELAYQEEIEELGGKVFFLPDVKKHPFKYRWDLYNLLQQEQYDVVHVNMLSAANILPLLVAHKAGVKKIIAHSHNSSTPGMIRNILHRINKRRIPQYVTDCFACSQIAGEWLFTEKLLKSNKFVVIHNAINVKRFLYDETECAAVREMLGLEGKWVIGHVGRFEEQKNHLFLIDIFSRLSQRDESAVLLLVGDGELKARAEKKVEELKLTEKVIFLGIRNDVETLLKSMDVFLLPSLFEGLPIVALEAQASGVYSFMADTISREVQIVDKVKFIRLDSSPEEWSDEIMKHCSYLRGGADNEKIYNQFEEAGYTIESAGKKLLAIYNR